VRGVTPSGSGHSRAEPEEVSVVPTSVPNAAHTPGPWEAIKGVEQSDDMRCGVAAVREDIRYLVATIENGAPGDFCDTEFANARLIAAAPELYDILNDIIWNGALRSDQHERLAKANAVLAKVRGR
jgi:hypothetical protein